MPSLNSIPEKVSPALNQESAIEKWDVDLQHSDRILTVQSEKLSSTDIIEIIQKTGFKAELTN